jgi:hypothetical protein
MSDTSAILGLPYLQPSQAQKHVTHNEALQQLDVLVQLTVQAFDAATPPALPQDGAVYALGVGAIGVWAGQDGGIAAWLDDMWQFRSPQVGWRAWGQDDSTLRIWDGSDWRLPTVEMNNLAGVGIGTTADATNRLAVRSEASLLSHDGAGHQLKLNKAAAGDTASLLFQTNWSGRVEMGLMGDDDFAIKTSADGSTWNTALSIASGTGNVTIGSINSLYPLTVTGNEAGAPITLRLQNWTGDASTIAATRGLVLSADHNNTFGNAKSFIAFEVDTQEHMRIAANGTVTVGVSAAKVALHIKDVLRLEPSAGPTVPVQGDIYFDSTTAKLRCYDGTIWQDLF